MLLLLLHSLDGPVIIPPPPTPIGIPVVLPTASHTRRSTRRYNASKTMYTAEKDPTDIFDYEIDWSDVLGEDTILISKWDIASGLTGVSGSNTSSTTTVWVSGGTAGIDYGVTNEITTTDGRTVARTMLVPVREL